MVDVNVFDVLVDSLREKGCTDSVILTEIGKLFDAFGFYSMNGKDSKVDDKTKIIYILDELGIPQQNLGYNYLVDAILEYRNKPTSNMRHGVYSKIAEKYGVSIPSIERAIRASIEIGCKNGRIETIQKMFGNLISENLGKPTNSQTIPFLAEKLDYFDFSELEKKNSFSEFVQQYREKGYSDHHIIIELGKVYNEFLEIKKMETTYECDAVKKEKILIADILEKLGVSNNIVGFHYLMYAVILYRQNLNHNYKDIYIKIAERFNSTPVRVENAITKALEVATKNSKPSMMKNIFGCIYRPNNHQAITMLAKAIG